ncbi:MAG TPA: hypothetical protein VFQ67_10675 [Allosphingosinicella sp.]|jgi:hypothetical protein|nr:hypothetical protein [Allosphingosinicella sp.]
MALQGENLAMVGLGVLGDQPPHPIQPVLPDGIHLRWAFDPELGFPWHGYHLFRRPHRPGKPTCIAAQWQGWVRKPPAGSTQTMAQGEMSSDSKLALAPTSDPADPAGIDLRGRTYLRFDLAADRPARSFELRIVFLPDRREEGGRGSNAEPAPDRRDRHGRLRTLLGSVIEQAEAAIRAPPPASLKAVAFDRGTPVASAILSPGPGALVTATLAADRMDRVEISGGPAMLMNLCFVPVDQEAGEGWGPIPGFPYPLCLPTAAPGYACKGRPVTAAQAESMALGRIRYGSPAAWSAQVGQLRGVLDSLAANPPAVGGQEMAERSGSYPDALNDPDKPVMPDQRPLDLVLIGAINPAVAQMVGLYWIDDPDRGAGSAASTEWAAVGTRDSAFVQGRPLQAADILTRVEPAPAPAARPRAAAILDRAAAAVAAQEKAAIAAAQEKAVLAAQEKAALAAQQTAPPSAAYDYLLIADHSGRYHGEPAEALAALAQPLPSDVDAWICFNLRKQKAAPLPMPEDVAVFALPGGSTDPATIAQDLVGAAGLRWRIEMTPEGDLLPGAAIGYHVWRAQLGSATPTAPPPLSAYAHVTASGMVMVAEPSPAPGGQGRPSDWPPWPMHRIDGRLAEGWYSYRVSGMDLFGRIGLMSPPAQWRQWAPEPAPRPWYYSGPAADAQVHPFAVRLLVKTPPPVVPGVEAWALDPLDPDLAGEARYDSWKALGWWNALSAADKRKRAGLRVRWRWDPEQMAQAPRTREFRLYLSPGGEPVPGHDDPLAWPQRIYAVDSATHFTPTPGGGRQYEVLLPEDSAGQAFPGVALEPTDLLPVVYAHVAVTAADDRSHSADQPKWAAGSWGGRPPGNEGRIGNAAKIFRVLRSAPPAPPLIGADDKVWASRADYHGISRYTFRWAKPSAGRKVHIFRTVDDNLFRTDWERRRAAGALAFAAADLAPFGWNAADQAAVLAELGAPLDAVKGLSWDDKPAVRAAYEKLSERALRALASFPGNDDAFVQTTFEPLDPALAANADRAGPDARTPYAPNPAWGACVAEIDGKASNRYFFRAAYVNAAHILGPMGPSSPAVYLPKVAPPRVPAITKVTSGELSITLQWAHNREPDFAEYRVYRADDERQARDVRLMALVATIAVADVDTTKPGVVWTDANGLIGGRTYLYSLTAVDGEGNESLPSARVPGRPLDRVPASAPHWIRAEWILYDPATKAVAPWQVGGPIPDPYIAAVRLELGSTADHCTIYRQLEGEGQWEELSAVVPAAGQVLLLVTDADPADRIRYRAVGSSSGGIRSPWSNTIAVEPAL